MDGGSQPLRAVASEAGRDSAVEGYRRQGIENTLNNLNAALVFAEDAFEWARSIPAVPDHVRPILREIIGKLRIVNDELKTMRVV